MCAAARSRARGQAAGPGGHDWASFTKVDDKGRVVLPGDLRRKLGINPGDEFAVDELGDDAIVLEKVDLKSLLDDIIEKAKDVDLDKNRNH